MNELVKKSTEGIKDKLYSCIESTFEKIESVKHDLSCIYEGVANDLDILNANEEQIPYSEAYNKGLEDAWKLAKKISHYTKEGLLDRFETTEIMCVFDEYTPQEALAKLEAYEKEKETIKVGDVVERIGFKELFIVSSFNEGIYTLINADGRCVCANVDQITKTGKHIDISSILEQIKED